MKHTFLFAQFIVDAFTDHKTLVAFIIVGVIAGVIAQLITPGRGHGMVVTAIVGLAGCFLSNMFVAGHITFIENHIVREFAGATVVAFIISLGINLVRGPERVPAQK